MEEDIPVRYTFMMMLAIADPIGLVVGTDIALARRLNMPLELFTKCVKQLQKPDPNSNSKEKDGRRLLRSDGEHGYQIVNYVKYRDMQDEEAKRLYMRTYMKAYRERKGPVKNVKKRKPKLAVLGQAEVQADVKEEVGGGGDPPPTVALALNWMESANQNGGDFKEAEVKAAFHSLSANGWMWGKNPVADYRSALESRIYSDRERKNSNERSKTSNRDSGQRRENPRNIGVSKGPTNYAEVFARKAREKQEALARQMAKDGDGASPETPTS